MSTDEQTKKWREELAKELRECYVSLIREARNISLYAQQHAISLDVDAEHMEAPMPTSEETEAMWERDKAAITAVASVLRDRRSEIEWGSLSIARAAIAAYDAARGGEDLKTERDELAGRLVAERNAHLEQEQQLRAALGGEAEGDARKALILLATAREGILVSDDDEAIDAVIDWGYEKKLLVSRAIASDEFEADLTKEGMAFIRAALSQHPEPDAFDDAEPSETRQAQYHAIVRLQGELAATKSERDEWKAKAKHRAQRFNELVEEQRSGQHPEPRQAEGDDPMPVFTIKAKDNFAFDAVLAYHELLRKTQGRMVEQAGEVWKALEEIAAWRDRNPDLCKDPDHEHVPAALSQHPEPRQAEERNEEAHVLTRIPNGDGTRAVTCSCRWSSPGHLSGADAIRAADEHLTKTVLHPEPRQAEGELRGKSTAAINAKWKRVVRARWVYDWIVDRQPGGAMGAAFAALIEADELPAAALPEPRQDQPVDRAWGETPSADSLCTCGHPFSWHWDDGGHCEHGDDRTGKRCACEKFIPVAHPKTGERDPIRPKCDGCGHYCKLHGPRGCHVPGCECERSPSVEPLQDGGERLTLGDRVAAGAYLRSFLDEQARRSDGPHGALEALQAFDSLFVARHPHQDVERELDETTNVLQRLLSVCEGGEYQPERVEVAALRLLAHHGKLNVDQQARFVALAPSPDDRGGER